MIQATTYHLRVYEIKLSEILRDVVKHGFGDIEILVHKVKENKTKIVIKAGRSWVFFIDREITDFKEGDFI